jgi:prolyl-tRNA synthetase
MIVQISYKNYSSHRIKIEKWEEVVPALDSKNVVLIPHCLEEKCEDKIKEITKGKPDETAGPAEQKVPSMGMKSLCIPFEQPDGLVVGQTKCLNPECSANAKEWCMFGRSY